MESEKVKDIKKALEEYIRQYSNFKAAELCKEALTLINELESENTKLKKYKYDWLNSEKMHLQADMEDTEFELFCAYKLLKELREENKKQNDRITELEDKIKNKMRET